MHVNKYVLNACKTPHWTGIRIAGLPSLAMYENLKTTIVYICQTQIYDNLKLPMMSFGLLE